MTRNQRVKEVRLALGLSQAKFAKAIAISNGYIAGIEVGNNKVNDRLIKLISLTFQVSEEWLKDGEGNMFQAPSDPLTLSPLAEKALAKFKELKPEYQEYVLKQIDLLLEIQQKEEAR